MKYDMILAKCAVFALLGAGAAAVAPQESVLYNDFPAPGGALQGSMA